MSALIERLIIAYLKARKVNASFERDGFVVRIFSKDFYGKWKKKVDEWWVNEGGNGK